MCFDSYSKRSTPWDPARFNSATQNRGTDGLVTWIAPSQVDLFSASCSKTSSRVTAGFVQPSGQPPFEFGGAWRSSDRVFDGELRATSVEIPSKSCCATKRAACVFRTRKSRSCVPRTLCSRTRPERTERSKTRTRVTVQLSLRPWTYERGLWVQVNMVGGYMRHFIGFCA